MGRFHSSEVGGVYQEYGYTGEGYVGSSIEVTTSFLSTSSFTACGAIHSEQTILVLSFPHSASWSELSLYDAERWTWQKAKVEHMRLFPLVPSFRLNRSLSCVPARILFQPVDIFSSYKQVTMI